MEGTKELKQEVNINTTNLYIVRMHLQRYCKFISPGLSGITSPTRRYEKGIKITNIHNKIAKLRTFLKLYMNLVALENKHNLQLYERVIVDLDSDTESKIIKYMTTLINLNSFFKNNNELSEAAMDIRLSYIKNISDFCWDLKNNL